MIALVIAAALAASVQGPDDGRWTWTLYENGDAVVLANEIPDTPALRAIFECARGSAVAQMTVYGTNGARHGFADLIAGEARATTEVEAGRDSGTVWLAAPIRLDHPVFGAFVDGGRLVVEQGERRWAVAAPTRRVAALDRFTQLCGGQG